MVLAAGSYALGAGAVGLLLVMRRESLFRFASGVTRRPVFRLCGFGGGGRVFERILELLVTVSRASEPIQRAGASMVARCLDPL